MISRWLGFSTHHGNVVCKYQYRIDMKKTINLITLTIFVMLFLAANLVVAQNENDHEVEMQVERLRKLAEHEMAVHRAKVELEILELTSRGQDTLFKLVAEGEARMNVVMSEGEAEIHALEKRARRNPINFTLRRDYFESKLDELECKYEHLLSQLELEYETKINALTAEYEKRVAIMEKKAELELYEIEMKYAAEEAQIVKR